MDNVGIRYSCDYCYKDISAIVRIQCAECGLAPAEESPLATDSVRISSSYSAVLEEVDLCVECFAAGVEFAHHRRTHSYRILRPLDFAVYSPGWRADEELLLLEAVESNGVGNWNDVAEQLASRPAEECKEHYMAVYIGNSAALSKGDIEASRESLRRNKLVTKRPRMMNSDDAIAATPTPQSVPANHEIAGFMPLRGEFETEHENDAEVAIKDLQFTEEDSPAERQLKFTMLDIYSTVLERRAARHAFIFSHRLVEFKRQQTVDKARSKEERDLYAMLKPFARLLEASDFQRLLEGLAREEELRRQIATLQDLRRHGIRSFEEVSAFETERKHLELYLKGGSLHPHPSSLPAQPTTKITLPIKEPHPLPAPSHFAQSSVPAAPLATTISIPRPSTIDPSATSTTPTPTGTPVNGIPLAPASSGGRKASTPLNISHAEGVELLSEKERHLCSILRLYPRLYLSIKDTLIREYLKLGGLKRAQARAAVKIDVNKTSKLYDFFVAAGWIKPPASGE